jgi:hypothetical protein
VRSNNYLKGSNESKPISWNKLQEIDEQRLALDVNAVSRVQDINAFSIGLSARHGESYNARIVFFRKLSIATVSIA